MKQRNIVLTGGTRGIGKGMAEGFLRKGHNLCITGRSQGSVAIALEALQPAVNGGKLVGVPCDAGNLDQVRKVWSTAVDNFKQVDIWINKSYGCSADPKFTGELL